MRPIITYIKALLCYNLCWSLLAYRFLSDPCIIRQVPLFLRPYLSSVFHCAGNVRVRVLVVFLRSVAEDSTHIARSRGEGEVKQVVKKFARVCTQNYSGSRFTALSRGPIPGPSTVPGTTGYWGDKLHGSCGSMTSRTRLRYIR